MEKAIWFAYGFLFASALVILGIIGYGIRLFWTIIYSAPVGLMFLAVIFLFVLVAYWIFKPKQVK